MTKNVLVERLGAIATVVLNRPEKLNALTRSMWKRLGAVLVEQARYVLSSSPGPRLRCTPMAHPSTRRVRAAHG